MASHSSGYYSIDADYNIIGFNDTAKQLYASLEKGKKCYAALMGLDAPCPACPIVNGISGPKTYLDPIRHIYETVDAVETVLPDGSHGHALVFSTVEEGERLSGSIPTGENALRLLGAINLLSSRYAVVLDVNVRTGRIEPFRAQPLYDGQQYELHDGMTYEEALESFLLRCVLPNDKQAMRERLSLSVLRERLSREASFKIHCKLLMKDVHYYYLLVARNGAADSFEDFVIAFSCEDDDINAQRIYEKQLDALIASLDSAPGYFHLDIAQNSIIRVGGYSEFVATLDPNASIDALMQAMASYIPHEQDRADFMQAYHLQAMKQAYDMGQVEVIRESLCDYDDHIARWSRYTLRLFVNPSNNHLEGVFYGTDISKDKEEHETQLSIIHSLARSYLDVLLLDTRTNTASIIKNRNILPAELVQTSDGSYPYDALIEHYIAALVHPEDQAMMREATRLSHVSEQLQHGPEYEGTYRILQDGRAHYYQFRFICNPAYGSVVLGLMDIDKIVARELEQQEKLQQALLEARRANAAKSRFLARMSHDMRTPLNGILGLLEIDAKHADDIEYLRRNRHKATIVTHHLVSLINDVLDMAKIEDGSLTLAHEPFNIMQEGAEASVLINLQAQEYGITTSVQTESWDERLSYVYGSPLHLRRALMNIYSNCVKYNKPNGSMTTRVRVVASDEQHVTFQWVITDTGIGMSQDFLPHLFEPFTQEKVDSRSVYQGTGLGMSITKAIIEQMGGTLAVTSELNVGSTFTVTIPFELADERDILHREVMENASIDGMRILLVEDNELNREVAATLLQEEHATVTCAVNGQEAVDIVDRLTEHAFDIILMDVMMPVMDGHEATRVLRARGVRIPIIAMTANAFTEDIQQSLAAGMDAHLAKPLDLNKLRWTLARYNKVRH
ncbi:MAG: response regulator [Aristaeellaceae bacterium]